ncbi:MAG: hypothetical protein Q9227_000256 [Pyrenula ochraceoflavens]
MPLERSDASCQDDVVDKSTGLEMIKEGKEAFYNDQKPILEVGKKVWLLDGPSGDSDCDTVYVINGVSHSCQSNCNCIDKETHTTSSHDHKQTDSIWAMETTRPTSSATGSSSFSGTTEEGASLCKRPPCQEDHFSYTLKHNQSCSLTSTNLAPSIATTATLGTATSTASTLSSSLTTPGSSATSSSDSSAASTSTGSANHYLPFPYPPSSRATRSKAPAFNLTAASQIHPTSLPSSSSSSPPPSNPTPHAYPSKPHHCTNCYEPSYTIHPESSPITTPTLEPGSSLSIHHSRSSTPSSPPPPPTTPTLIPASSNHHRHLLHPIKYRPGQIVRVTKHWDERTVTRVRVRGGRAFYDLVGCLNDDDDDNNALELDGSKSSTRTAAATEEGGDGRQERPAQRGFDRDDEEGQGGDVDYLNYAEACLRRFTGDEMVLGEEVGGQVRGGRVMGWEAERRWVEKERVRG